MKTTAQLVWVCALLACGGPAVQQTPVQPADGAAAGAATITPGDMHARISFLASDALRGRDTPSPGLETAAAYIAAEFRRLGLEPKGDSGTYVQRYPYVTRTVRTDSVRLNVQIGRDALSFAPGSEIFAVPGSAPRAAGELVFTGSRIGEEDGPGVRGRVPVVYVSGRLSPGWRNNVLQIRAAATRHGASGVVLVLDPQVTAENIQRAAANFGVSRNVMTVVPAIALRYDRARELFRRAGHQLDPLASRSANEAFQPIVLGRARASFTTPVESIEHRPPNVIGVLPGSDPQLRNTYIVLSAHMDHVGVGNPDASGDSIYNGADDDASGTSAVLEVAEALAALSTRPLRSVLFLTVSGEEKGLVGSAWFADHPTVPIGSIIANINMDMIGRNAPDTAVAIGLEYSSLGPLAQRVVQTHPELGLTVVPDQWPQERLFFRSDHFNFARKEIPAIFFFSGLHEDYHQPSDEFEKIDASKASRIAKLAYYLAYEIANTRTAPTWTEQGLREIRALTR